MRTNPVTRMFCLALAVMLCLSAASAAYASSADEAVLDRIIVAIERQQDKLFQSDALDVETDISVLKTMMSADGLTGDDGLHT